MLCAVAATGAFAQTKCLTQDEIKRFTDQIVARSAATIRLGKAAFYQQIERPLAPAYEVASETMACNMGLEDAAEGIDAFLQKRPAAWKGR